MVNSNFLNQENDARKVFVQNFAVVDAETNAQINIDLVHHEIHEGCSYSYTDFVSLAEDAVQYYMFTTSSVIPEGRTRPPVPNFGMQIESNGPMTVEIFESSTHTGTTPQTAFNRNRLSENTAATAIHKGASGGSDGTRLWVWSGGVANNKTTAGGSPGTAGEWNLEAGVKYLVKITSGMDSNVISSRFDWYENGICGEE